MVEPVERLGGDDGINTVRIEPGFSAVPSTTVTPGSVAMRVLRIAATGSTAIGLQPAATSCDVKVPVPAPALDNHTVGVPFDEAVDERRVVARTH